jgi:hypothetical protein
VTQELDGVEQNVESFKRTNNVLDVENESSRLTQESNEYERKLEEWLIILKHFGPGNFALFMIFILLNY